MPTFKPKNTKKIVISHKESTTLDGKHAEHQGQFAANRTTLVPELQLKRKRLKEELTEGSLGLERRLEIEDELKQIRKEISRVKNMEKSYYLDNSKHIFDYFESKKDIAEGNSKPTMLDNFFNLVSDPVEKSSKDQTNVQQYLANIDEAFLDMGNFVVQTDVCTTCHRGEMVPVDQEGILVCNNCSVSVRYLVENEKPSYKEPPKEVCFYAYKRINHFREILAQFQAKETTQIPDAVLHSIKLQIKRERLSLSQVTNKKAKEILKKLGYNKYYEHIPFIKDKLGIKPPIMSPELEERLCNLFMDIQGPYAKYCPEDRVNFLNYYYTVYKLCELLDQNQFLPYFPMLKDREKRIEQDEIWKKICSELDWEFIPTV